MRFVSILSLLFFAGCSSSSKAPSLGEDTKHESDMGADGSTNTDIAAPDSVGPVCNPGQGYCDGNTVKRCTKDGSGYANVITCLSPDVCFAASCCTPQCDGLVCGDNACGGLCGACEQGTHCEAGVCVPGDCNPECSGRECGADGCGGLCGTCPVGELCVALMCLPPDSCMEACEERECGYVDECMCGECSAGYLCVANKCVDANSPCAEDCVNKECGEVGDCVCGNCSELSECVDYKCQPKPDPCFEICAGKECGELEGCLCGTCQGGMFCDNYDCKPATGPCVGLCANKNCGNVGECDCGTCDQGWSCVENNCQCDKQCVGKECGPDGCGGNCGVCQGDAVCNEFGKCSNPGCSIMDWQFSSRTARIASLAFGEDGKPGNGLNVDGDLDTCTPSKSCSSGIDNNLGGSLQSVSGIIGDPSYLLQNAVTGGKLHFLLELVPSSAGWMVYMYLGDLTEGPWCDFMAQKCDYVAMKASFNVLDCGPLMELQADSDADSFSAGNPDVVLPVPFEIAAGASVTINIYRLHISGDYTFSDGNFVVTSGILGGAILKSDLTILINAIPSGILPVSPDYILSFMDGIMAPDQDVDGDGTKDAYSVGIKYTAIPANIVGID